MLSLPKLEIVNESGVDLRVQVEGIRKLAKKSMMSTLLWVSSTDDLSNDVIDSYSRVPIGDTKSILCTKSHFAYKVTVRLFSHRQRIVRQVILPPNTQWTILSSHFDVDSTNFYCVSIFTFIFATSSIALVTFYCIYST